ncbi:hypothetical protein ACN0IV_12730 [Trabulsiella odontotermitis]|uniref:hypothetical protein n=1 Tax=Trabulsiella odontotermitis TaxID=379893 RepID=UPI003AD648B2
MPSLDEIATQTGSQLSGVLKTAVETLSASQEITFRLYVLKVLPLDGFIFWVNAALLSADELTAMGVTSPLTTTIQGSLHRQVVSEQSATASRDVNNIIFTPIAQADDFNVENPNAIYLGEYGTTRFAFSRLESRYTQSGIFHYRGTAILPTMMSQIIDSTDDISDDQIISNSIPVWLAINSMAPVYPSFLTPPNLRPPYIAVDVRNTQPLQIAPHVINGMRYQFAQDTVRITLYGFSNKMALDYVDSVVSAALDDEQFGVSNIPIVTDGKSNQVEINALAKQKTVDFEVNYYQATTRDLSRQLIKEAIFNYEVK